MNRSSSSISNSETADFSRLAKRLVVLLLPFLLAAGLIFVVDPFNFFAVSQIIPKDIKAPIASQFNPCFWQLNKFEHEPRENVLLGDSRMILLPGEVKEVSGEDYANLGFGGGTVREIVDAFKVVSKKVALKKVYIGLNLDKYNDYEINNRMTFYNAAHENPALYFLNQAVWQTAYYEVKTALSGEKFKIGVPNMSKDEFWDEELAVETKYYEKYVEPVKYRKELSELAAFCRENNIKLSFIIFPTHVDAQQLIANTQMIENREKMLKDFNSGGDVYDFDWSNELTANKNNFNDPVHMNADVRKIVTREIWTNRFKFARFYPQNSLGN